MKKPLGLTLSGLLSLGVAGAWAAGAPVTLSDPSGNYLGTPSNPIYTSPGSGSGPSSVVTTPGTCAITSSFPSGTSGLLAAANSNRKSIRWMNIGGTDVTVDVGPSPPTVGRGMIYDTTAAGRQGGSDSFADPASPTNAFSFSAASSASLVVWECQ